MKWAYEATLAETRQLNCLTGTFITNWRDGRQKMTSFKKIANLAIMLLLLIECNNILNNNETQIEKFYIL